MRIAQPGFFSVNAFLIFTVPFPFLIRVIFENLARQVQTLAVKEVSRSIERGFRASVFVDVF